MGRCVCGKEYPDDWAVQTVRGRDGRFRAVIPAHWPACFEKAKNMGEPRGR